MPEMHPRIGAIPRSEWPDRVRQPFASVDGLPHESSSRFLGILANHPDVGIPLARFMTHVLHASTLPSRVLELVTLRTVWLNRSQLLWSAHVPQALAAGLTTQEIEAVKSGAEAADWSGLDRALLRALDPIANSSEVDDEAWDILTSHYSYQQLLDIVFAIGNYAMLAMATNVFRISPEPGSGRLGQPSSAYRAPYKRQPSANRPKRGSRIPAVPPSGWTERVRDVFAVFEGEVGRERGSKYNVTLMFANHPELLLAFLPLNKHLLQTCSLSVRIFELSILRMNFHHFSEYQWFHRVEFAEKAGITFDEIRAISQADAMVWSSMERLIFRAVDQLCEQSDIDDETWNELAAAFDSRQLIDLVFTIGDYMMVGSVFNVAGLVLEPAYERYRLCAPPPARNGPNGGGSG